VSAIKSVQIGHELGVGRYGNEKQDLKAKWIRCELRTQAYLVDYKRLLLRFLHSGHRITQSGHFPLGFCPKCYVGFCPDSSISSLLMSDAHAILAHNEYSSTKEAFKRVIQ
jgi:hypothetical protein